MTNSILPGILGRCQYINPEGKYRMQTDMPDKVAMATFLSFITC